MKSFKFCEQCKNQSLKSNIVFDDRKGKPVWREFYAEDGKFHAHNKTKQTRQYRCSNGHDWMEDETLKCWCEKK